MAIVNAVKSGNWSDPTVWSTGSVPVNGDTVSAVSFVVDFDVDIDQPLTMLKATTGRFRHVGTTTRTVRASADSGEFSGTQGLVVNSNTGTLIFVGNGKGSIVVSSATCFLNTWYGRFRVMGIVTGGGLSFSYGANNQNTGIMEIDTAVAGETAFPPAHGAINNSGGTLIVDLAIGNGYGPGRPIASSVAVFGQNNVGQFTYVRKIQFGPYGAVPVGGAVLLDNSATNTAQFRIAPGGTTKTLADPATFADSPVPADVRAGTEYNYGNNVGTCAVPLPSQVSAGTAVDDAIGTAVITEDQLYAVLQRNPAFTAERTLGDDKPLTFSWPNSTDAIQGEVSLDNGTYAPITGNISYLRNENGKHYYILEYNPADRPTEEGTARYKLYSGTHTMYATLRTIEDFEPILERLPEELDDGRIKATISDDQAGSIQSGIVQQLKKYEVS